MPDIIGIIFLLLTGLAAAAYGYFLLKNYFEEKKLYHLYWAISFLVLFVSGVLIIIFDWDVLGAKLVPAVAALIPACLAIGLFYAVWEDKKYGFYFSLYAFLMIIVLAIYTLVGDDSLTPFLVMSIHVPSALVIVLVPIYTAMQGITENSSIYFSIGGILISFGGMLLALVKVVSPDEDVMGFINLDFIYTVLPILLLLVAGFFILGIIYPTKWKIKY